MLVISIINFLLSGFLGYLLGRFGDYHVNFWMKDPWWLPHHWIYGLIIMVASFFLFQNYWNIIFPFGGGHFISDLKDFLELKFIGSDKKDKATRRFWHID
jgi:hypothetical protein